jgi:hypothetical protein
MSYYLSIIATTRNDNHGGDLLRRTSTFINNVYSQSKKWNLQVELIIVEWNPPADKPLLNSVLPQPVKNSNVTLRYIEVPAETHSDFKNAQFIPLYQMIAKNVGIRKAKGEFILCTNIDILFSDECFKLLAQKKLEQGKFYRANRCDIPKEVMNIEDTNEQLNYASKSITKRLGKSPGHETLSLPDWMYFSTKLMWLANFFILQLWKLTHPNRFPHFTIDFDACGDFTLMSKQDWLDIEGYVELDMYSIHIDSMALWAATALGKQQVLFPQKACVYHIYHEDGWESNDALKTIRFLQYKPCLDHSIVLKGGLQILQSKQHWQMNKPDWGFANHQFEEYVFNPF